MCGIAGYYTNDKTWGEADLNAMLMKLNHRGPDASGIYFDEDGAVGLGHTRLSILDLSDTANQPMHSHNGRYVIVYNGEVYNYQELALNHKKTWRTNCDTEVILESFAENGIRAVEEFNGMFSFAVYDKKEKKLHFLRDRIGIKPLFYFDDGKNFAFASEVKALLATPFIANRKSIDHEAIGQYLHLGYIPEPKTIFKHIYKFPAGHYGVYDGRELKVQSYWKAEDQVMPEAISDLSSAKDYLKELINSSVKYRLISDVPYGTFLSGGIDSSLVTAVAQSLSDRPVKTFNIGFKEQKFNESRFAQDVATHLGTDHHEFLLEYKEAIPLLEEIIDTYDEPFADSSAIPTMLVSKMARQKVTMTLSGDGGDELFMGYGAYKWANRLNHPLAKIGGLPTRLLLQASGKNRLKRAAQMFGERNYNLQSHIFSQEQYLFSQRDLESLLVVKGETFRPDINWKAIKRSLTTSEQQALFDLKYYLKDDLLVKVDRASMKYSLETRVPLLDYRIVEFALNLQQNMKMKNGTLKHILKEVLFEYVPAHYFDRPKAGFAIPLVHWLKNEARYLIEDYLNPVIIKKYGVLRPDTVARYIRKFDGGEDYLYNRLWQMIILHKFLEKHGQ